MTPFARPSVHPATLAHLHRLLASFTSLKQLDFGWSSTAAVAPCTLTLTSHLRVRAEVERLNHDRLCAMDNGIFYLLSPPRVGSRSLIIGQPSPDMLRCAAYVILYLCEEPLLAAQPNSCRTGPPPINLEFRTPHVHRPTLIADPESFRAQLQEQYPVPERYIEESESETEAPRTRFSWRQLLSRTREYSVRRPREEDESHVFVPQLPQRAQRVHSARTLESRA